MEHYSHSVYWRFRLRKTSDECWLIIGSASLSRKNMSAFLGRDLMRLINHRLRKDWREWSLVLAKLVVVSCNIKWCLQNILIVVNHLTLENMSIDHHWYWKLQATCLKEQFAFGRSFIHLVSWHSKTFIKLCLYYKFSK